MSEILYPAQQLFPPKCVRCPMLVGLIEDGYISSDEISQAEVIDGLRENCSEQNFERCPGPDEYVSNGEEIITCTLLKGVE